MKKFLVLILALAMVMAMASVVSAQTFDNISTGENNWAAENNASGEVEIKVVEGADTVYKVDVTWTSLQFTYSFGTWNTDNHTYGTGSWDKTAATITITNHSNEAIDFKAQIEGDLTTTYKNVVSTLTAGTATTDSSVAKDAVNKCISGTLASADNAAYHGDTDAPNATINLDITGVPNVFSTADFEQAGTITVTISEP